MDPSRLAHSLVSLENLENRKTGDRLQIRRGRASLVCGADQPTEPTGTVRQLSAKSRWCSVLEHAALCPARIDLLKAMESPQRGVA